MHHQPATTLPLIDPDWLDSLDDQDEGYYCQNEWERELVTLFRQIPKPDRARALALATQAVKEVKASMKTDTPAQH